MSTLTYNTYYQEIEKSFEQTGKSLDYHLHAFYQNFYKHVEENDNDRLSAFIPKECETMLKLNSKFWNRQIQFILETFQRCVIAHGWNVVEFMDNCALFSSISHMSKPWKLVEKYLTEYMRYIASPINHNESEENDDDDDDDDDCECKHETESSTLSQELQHSEFRKHNMDRILYYLFQVHEGMIMNRTENHRQIDMVFLPAELEQINDTFFAEQQIKYTKLSDFNGVQELLDNFHSSRAASPFCRSVMLIIGGENTGIDDERVYLFELLNTENIPESLLNYTEMPMIYNATHNPQWFNEIVQKYNGLTLGYHHHSVDSAHIKNISTRLYVWYQSRSGQRYGTRVLKENIMDVLRGFCSDSDDIVNWEENVKFRDFAYSEFLYLFLNEFAPVNVGMNDSERSISLRSGSPMDLWSSSERTQSIAGNTEEEVQSSSASLPVSHSDGSVSLQSAVVSGPPSDWNRSVAGISEEEVPSPTSGTSVSSIEIMRQIERGVSVNAGSSSSDDGSISFRSATVSGAPSEWSGDSRNGITDAESVSNVSGTSLSQIEISRSISVENDSDSESEVMPNPFPTFLLQNPTLFRNPLIRYGKHDTLVSNAGWLSHRNIMESMAVICVVRHVQFYWMLQMYLAYLVFVSNKK